MAYQFFKVPSNAEILSFHLFYLSSTVYLPLCEVMEEQKWMKQWFSSWGAYSLKRKTDMVSVPILNTQGVGTLNWKCPQRAESLVIPLGLTVFTLSECLSPRLCGAYLFNSPSVGFFPWNTFLVFSWSLTSSLFTDCSRNLFIFHTYITATLFFFFFFKLKVVDAWCFILESLWLPFLFHWSSSLHYALGQFWKLVFRTMGELGYVLWNLSFWQNFFTWCFYFTDTCLN